MTDTVGRKLFESALSPSQDTEVEGVKLSTTKLRRKAIETPSKL